MLNKDKYVKVNKTGSFGTSSIWLVFGNEALVAVYDCRWLIALCFIVMIADMWWAYSEHLYWNIHAKTADEKKKNEWRKSRAIRRTSMKFVDYLTLLIVGVVFGMAIFEPLGICDHVATAAVGVLIGIASDIFSIVGHICVVRELKLTSHSLGYFMKRFAVALIKTKSEDVGEALENTLTDIKDEEPNRKGM